MSKTTKIIAALGVVAGLGVAALPAFTFAEGGPSVSGDVDLYVKVNPAIAMTITGNNDNAEAANHIDKGADHDGHTHGSVARTTVAGAWGINANLNTSSSSIVMNPNSFDTTDSTVTVYTNNATGYNLNVIADSEADLVLDQNNSIAADATGFVDVASGATETTPGGLGKWAYKINASEHVEGDDILAANTYAAMPDRSGTAQTLRNKGTKTTGGDPTVVTYGVSTAADQAAGTYMTTLTYTATCNN